MKLFQYPTKLFFITQKYGCPGKNYGAKGHTGLDLRIINDTKREIMASRDGVVVVVDDTSDFNWFSPGSWKKGSPYGNHIIIKHIIDNVPYYTLYGHLKNPIVKVGDNVKAGQLIGEGGNTGLSSAPHLHFEVRSGSNSSNCVVDPLPLLTEKLLAPLSIPDLNIPEWAEESLAWVKENGLFEITNQNDVREAVKFKRLYDLILKKIQE